MIKIQDQIVVKLLGVICFCSILMGYTPPPENNSSAPDNRRSVSDSLVGHLLPDVTISAPRSGNPIMNATGSYTVMPVDPQRVVNPVSMDQYLNQVPGIAMQSGSVNTQRLTIRGMGSRTPYSTNRIKAYYGQIPLTTADGVSSLDGMDPMMVGKAEVVKGPSSALYGSGLGGVIVMEPSMSEKPGRMVNVSTHAGSFGLYKVGGNLTISSPKGTWGIGAQGTTWEGYRENGSSRQFSAMSFYNYNASKHRLSLLAMVSGQKAGIPSSLNINQFENDPGQAAPNWLAVKGHEINNRILLGVTSAVRLKPRLSNSLTVYGSLTDGYEHRPFNVLDDGSLLVGAKNSLEYTTGHSKNVIGVEHMAEHYSAKFLETRGTTSGSLLQYDLHRRQSTNVFGWSSWQILRRWILTAGINLNLTQYRVTDKFTADEQDRSGKRRFPLITSPRLGMNYRITTDWHAFASAGHGFSHPSAEETLLPEGVINPGLKPEQGWTFEIGTRSKIASNLHLEVAYYRIWLDDLLVTKRLNESVFYGENAGKTNHHGLELSVNGGWKLSSQVINRLQGQLGLWYSANRFESFIDNEEDYSGNHLPGIPDRTFAGNIVGTFSRNVDIVINYQHRGGEWLNDSNRDWMKSSNQLDLKIAYRLLTSEMNMTISGGMQNVFNEKYASMVVVNAPSINNSLPRYYYPALPASVFGSLLLTFK